MRGRNLFGYRRRLGAGWLILLSVSFLLLSVVFSITTLKHSAHSSLADSINASVGVARASALEATPQDTVLATGPIIEPVVTTDISDSLTKLLSDWQAKQPTTQQWGVVVRSLDNESVNARVHNDLSFGSASIFKLYLTYGLNKLVPSAQWNTTHIDSSHTYADCVQAMMAKSDNQCATEIGDKLGWLKVSSLLAPAGYTHTSLKADPTPTTPADTAQIMSDIYNRKGFSNDASSLMIDAMSHSIFRKGIVAGCPDCQVANKTGDLNGSLHDAAIITINGKHYVLVVMSRGGSQTQIAAVTRLVHDSLVDHQ